MKEEMQIEAKSNLKHLSGFTSYNLPEHQAFHHFYETIRSVYELYGFAAFYPPPIERLENLLVKGGINNQIYQLATKDHKLTEMGLPFDRTVSLALFVAKEMNNSISFPFKRYDNSYSFRGERAAQGRFRGFYQCDVDIIDKEVNLDCQAECIAAIYDALKALNVGSFTVHINQISLTKAILNLFEIVETEHPEYLHVIDKMPKVTEDVTKKALLDLGLQEEMIESFVQIFNYKGTIEEFLSFIEKLVSVSKDISEEISKYVDELIQLMQILETYRIDLHKIQFNPQMARGLNYYTGIVFETFLDNLEHVGSIASGGKYANLVDVFIGREVSIEGMGGSIGLTRLFDICLKNGIIQPQRQVIADVAILTRESSLKPLANKLAHALRKKNIKIDVNHTTKKISKQLNLSNKKGFRYVAMVMDAESFVVKDLMEQKQQDFSNMEEVVQFLNDFLC